MSSPLDAASAAYVKVWDSYGNITATNVDEVRLRALTAAIRTVFKDCEETADKHLSANPDATWAEIRKAIVGRWALLQC